MDSGIDLPRIGAKIRVVRTYASGTFTVAEGIVSEVDSNPTAPYVMLEGGATAGLWDDSGSWDGIASRAEWIELEPPKPALPPQPAVGALVQVGANLFRRRRDRDGYEYTELTEEPIAHRTWEYVCSLGTPVLLVPAPDLAELVEALRKLVVLLHNDHLHGDDFEQCEEHHCGLSALPARYETEAAQ